MEDFHLSETEQRYFGDLFTCCDAEKTGKVPIYKASELFRSANLPLDVLKQITESVGACGASGGAVGRRQFFAALKLIAAYQAGLPLRTDVQAPLPRLGWPSASATPTPPPPITGSVWEQVQTTRVGSPDLIQLSDTDPTPIPQGEGEGEGAVVGGSNGRSSCSSSSPSPQGLVAAAGSGVGAIGSGVGAIGDALCSGSSVVAMEGGVPRAVRSPEASSTASDSPTPTNSAQGGRWAEQRRWHGLVCEEQRQLLGTEEESSDRHSSDEEGDDEAAAAAAAQQVWTISPEQREYYGAQFRSLQPDPQGLVAGPVARLFFEKSRLPVHELRRIWQLSDVTKDGALSLAEFNTAMHLVVLRRNHIALPQTLPPSLVPWDSAVTAANAMAPVQQQQQQQAGSPSGGASSSAASSTSSPDARAGPPPPTHAPPPGPSPCSVPPAGTAEAAAGAGVGGSPGALSLSSCHDEQQQQRSPPDASASLPPTTTAPLSATAAVRNQVKEWTKFVDSPTSSVSSPGPKPVNFDFHKSAVEQDPKILHPVALRLTPEQLQSSADAVDEPCRSPRRLALPDASAPTVTPVPYEPLAGDAGAGAAQGQAAATGASPKKATGADATDLRRIQRPTAKKPAASGPGVLPPPPSTQLSQDDASPVSLISVSGGVASGVGGGGGLRKDPPPPPPPRPIRSHARSSSLDLNRLGPAAPGTPPVVPPRVSPSTTSPRKLLGQRSEGDVLSLVSFPAAAAPSSITAAGDAAHGAFADFAQHFAPRAASSFASSFLAATAGGGDVTEEAQPPRKHGAFEVYRKQPSAAAAAAAAASAAATQLEAVGLPGAEVSSPVATDSCSTVAPHRGGREAVRRLQEQNALLSRVCTALARELAVVTAERAALESRLQQLRLPHSLSHSLHSAHGSTHLGGASNASTEQEMMVSSLPQPSTALE